MLATCEQSSVLFAQAVNLALVITIGAFGKLISCVSYEWVFVAHRVKSSLTGLPSFSALRISAGIWPGRTAWTSIKWREKTVSLREEKAQSVQNSLDCRSRFILAPFWPARTWLDLKIRLDAL